MGEILREIEAEGLAADETLYNEWYDVADLLTLFGSWAVVELTPHYIELVDRLRSAVDRFEEPKEVQRKDWQQLEQAFGSDLLDLCEGLALVARFVERLGVEMDSEMPYISFAFLPQGRVRLQGWTDSPAAGTAEYEEEQETIAFLVDTFQQFFYAPLPAMSLTPLQAAELHLSNAEYEEAVAQFLAALREVPTKEHQAIFLRLYEAYKGLQRWREATDVLMKAYLLGLHKSKIRPQILDICRLMLAREDIKSDKNERERWERLQEDFS